MTQTETPEYDDLDHVAVIGMAGRFPGSPDIETFWRNLEAGREGIARLSEEELLEAGVSPEQVRRDDFVPAKGVLEGADLFDAGFFGFSPREAEVMDPQHRVFLECAWEALETAGYDPHSYGGRVGVFAGTGVGSYMLFNASRNRAAVDSTGLYQMMLANDKDFLATRVSYKLGLTGPGITVQTACSTSLTAIHLACQSLLNGECEIAIAGGVSVTSPLKDGYRYEKGGILSPDGHCRAFSADAGGTVPGNGVGVVVLRKLADARTDGDLVDAVILATAVNNDGSLKAGYTAPSVEGQAQVVAEAWAVADADPATAGYIETHGTATPLGDPIEVAALTKVFQESTQDRKTCAIGSVKSNVGHLDAAAGVTGFIKTVLALKHGAIPPSIMHTEPNPELDLDSGPFYVNTELRPWPRGPQPRRAGVSSFGIGGTNVHVVLEEAPQPAAPQPAAPQAAAPERDAAGKAWALPLAAKSAKALADGARRLADHLERTPDLDLGDVAFTLARRRLTFDHRDAVVCHDTDSAVHALRRLADADRTGQPPVAKQPRVAFLFPGQGAQHVGMAQGLYRAEPVFREEFDRCAELFAAHIGADLRALVHPPSDVPADEAAARLTRTEIAQPALFAVEYALAKLWLSWGVRPDVMAGHSIGEYVAACLAGVFSLPDAVSVVAARGRIVQSMPPGSMLTVFLPEAEVAAWLQDGLCLAAANSTGLSVVSGPADAVQALEARLKAAGIGCRVLHTSHAFHSSDMDGAVGPFVAEVRKVPLHPPVIPFCSDVTGTLITDEQATSPEYWGTHLREPVRFSAALDVLLAEPDLVPIEVGPGSTLGGFARQHAAWRDGRPLIASLPHPKEPGDDHEHQLAGVAAAWRAGVPIDWSGRCAPEAHRLLRLPTYAFQRQRYWLDADDEPLRPARSAGKRPADEWFYTPGWHRLPPAAPETAGADTVWAVVGTGTGLGDALAKRLADDGATVVRVATGTQLEPGEQSWTLDPGDREHLARLVTALDGTHPPAIRIVHLGGTAPAQPHGGDEVDAERIAAARRTGFDALLALAQGIADARPTAEVTVDVLCDGVFAVTGAERLRPENALLLGPATVLPQETANTSCRVLDVTGCDPDAPRDDAVRAVHAMLTRPGAGHQLALRGRHWWARDFDRITLAGTPEHTALRDGGAYLVTGGLGGIGLAMAEVIAEGAQRPVIGLLGRSPFPAEQEWDAWLAAHGEQDPTSVRIRRLRGLKELGARPVVLRADVTDRAETAAAVAELRRVAGRLDAVVHAAGLPSRGMMAGKSAADAAEVLAAKTVGTLVLDQVCGPELDFVLLCSSVTSTLGGPGQSDYCAANAFLDAYAQWKRQEHGAPVTAVAWDTWRDVGMAAGLVTEVGGGPAPAHPLLDRVVSTTEGSRTYATTFSTADRWIVDDHRIMGHGLVPGTTYLELVRAAVAVEDGERDVEIRDVVYPMPVVVPDGQTREVFTSIERDLADAGAPWRFTVRSRASGGGWQVHATGSAVLHEHEADVVRDLDQVLADCRITEVLDTERKIKQALRLDRFEKGGPIEFSFGPRWRCMREIRVGERGVFATLQLDDEFAGDLDGYVLHPALLDVAGGTARVNAPETYYLPFTYRSLRVLHPMTGTVHCAVELVESADSSGETLTCNLDVLDPNGLLLVRISGFTIKRINDVVGLREQIEQSVATWRDPGDDDGDGDGQQAAAGQGAGTLRALAEGISEAEGKAVFAAVLAARPPEQLVVAHRDFAEMRELARAITPALLAAELQEFAPAAGSHPRPDLATPYVAPQTDDEQAVAVIWQEVLGVDEVGRDDDFFALGGHSLAAVQIGAKVQNRFGVELDLRRFFDAPTVANTAALLAGGGASTDDGVPALRRGEALELTEEALEPADGAGELTDLETLSDAEVEAQLRELLAAEGSPTAWEAPETNDQENG
jgi:phthiocerol/phenolphthiocerol synthesis type-I polyketide synthase E